MFDKGRLLLVPVQREFPRGVGGPIRIVALVGIALSAPGPGPRRTGAGLCWAGDPRVPPRPRGLLARGAQAWEASCAAGEGGLCGLKNRTPAPLDVEAGEGSRSSDGRGYWGAGAGAGSAGAGSVGAAGAPPSAGAGAGAAPPQAAAASVAMGRI